MGVREGHYKGKLGTSLIYSSSPKIQLMQNQDKHVLLVLVNLCRSEHQGKQGKKEEERTAFLELS